MRPAGLRRMGFANPVTNVSCLTGFARGRLTSRAGRRRVHDINNASAREADQNPTAIYRATRGIRTSREHHRARAHRALAIRQRRKLLPLRRRQSQLQSGIAFHANNVRPDTARQRTRCRRPAQTWAR